MYRIGFRATRGMGPGRRRQREVAKAQAAGVGEEISFVLRAFPVQSSFVDIGSNPSRLSVHHRVGARLQRVSDTLLGHDQLLPTRHIS